MSIQFHKIWIEQCEATEGIRENYGLQNALDYLIARSFSISCKPLNSTRSLPQNCRHSSPRSTGYYGRADPCVSR
jgi:hypothetical protein